MVFDTITVPELLLINTETLSALVSEQAVTGEKLFCNQTSCASNWLTIEKRSIQASEIRTSIVKLGWQIYFTNNGAKCISKFPHPIAFSATSIEIRQICFVHVTILTSVRIIACTLKMYECRNALFEDICTSELAVHFFTRLFPVWSGTLLLVMAASR